MSSSPTVRFNVGGTAYEVSRSLIDQFPDTLLSKLLLENQESDEPIFVDRDGERFRYVLDYMRDGKMQLALTVSKAALLREMTHYGINVNEEAVDDSAIRENVMAKVPLYLIQYCDEMEDLEKRKRYLDFAHRCFVCVCKEPKTNRKNSYCLSFTPDTPMQSSLPKSEEHLNFEYARSVICGGFDLDLLNEYLGRYGFRYQTCALNSTSCGITIEIN